MIPPSRSKSSNFNCFGVRKLSLRVNPPDRDSIGNSQHAFRTRPQKPSLKSVYGKRRSKDELWETIRE